MRLLTLTADENGTAPDSALPVITDESRFNALFNLSSQKFWCDHPYCCRSKEVAELDKDLRALVKMWEDGMARMVEANPRDKVIGELNKHLPFFAMF